MYSYRPDRRYEARRHPDFSSLLLAPLPARALSQNFARATHLGFQSISFSNAISALPASADTVTSAEYHRLDAPSTSRHRNLTSRVKVTAQLHPTPHSISSWRTQVTPTGPAAALAVPLNRNFKGLCCNVPSVSWPNTVPESAKRGNGRPQAPMRGLGEHERQSRSGSRAHVHGTEQSARSGR